MRSEAEVLERLAGLKSDFFGAQCAQLLFGISFETAKANGLLPEEYLKKIESGESQKWEKTTDERIQNSIVGYLDFAWDKATGHRGLSASRSLDHFRGWCWLLGDDEALSFIDDDANFPQYGAPILMYLSKRFGHTPPSGEDAKNMAQGLSCSPYCEDGCGV
jgi:hypothetical protein